MVRATQISIQSAFQFWAQSCYNGRLTKLSLIGYYVRLLETKFNVDWMNENILYTILTV
jgi:archaellum component FlaF (FlaF/FlaG flagellin family)